MCSQTNQTHVSAHTPGAGFPERYISRIERWERKLLDLSLNNSLLSLTDTPSVPLHEQDPTGVERSLRSSEMRLNACSEQSCTASALYTDLSGEALTSVLKSLWKMTNQYLDDYGVQVLYLAIGMLHWKDEKNDAHCAPLMLLPVRLKQNTSAGGFTLRALDRETAFNITLLEKLRNEPTLHDLMEKLVELPQQGGIVEYPRVFAALSEVVSTYHEDWQITKQMVLGCFAFHHIDMWYDINRRAQAVLEHPISGSLVAGHLLEKARPALLPSAFPEMYLPYPADASQRNAIAYAMRGDSFVLEGPPGTGKSQTITNMIVNLLMQGKRVLFVAEKKAALTVVLDRLRALHLQYLCFELHSDKTSAKDILVELAERTRVPAPIEPVGRNVSPFERSPEQQALQDYNDEMNRPLPCGLTLRQLISELDALQQQPALPCSAAPMTAEELQQCEGVVRDMVASTEHLGVPGRHPLHALKPIVFEHAQLREKLVPLASSYMERSRDFLAAAEKLAAHIGYGLEATEASRQELTLIAAVLRFWSSPKRRKLVHLSGMPKEIFTLLQAVNEMESSVEQRRRLEAQWQPGFFDLDGAELHASYKTALNSPLRRLPVHMQLKRVLETQLKTRRSLTDIEIGMALGALKAYQQMCARFQQLPQELKDALTDDTNTANWKVLRAELQTMLQNAEIPAVQRTCHIYQRFAEDEAAVALSTELECVWKQLNDSEELLDHLVTLSPRKQQDEDRIARNREILEALCPVLDNVYEWEAWLRCAEALNKQGFGALVNAFANGEISGSAAVPAWRKMVYTALVQQRLAELPELSGYETSPLMLTDITRHAKEQEEQIRQTTRRMLEFEFQRRMHEMSRQLASDPLCVELNKKASQTSVRKLRSFLTSIAPLIARLCPCMMMSPSSIAQFLPDELPDFDVVIFDEASQLETCRAVGALSRASSAIIVGDPKQMPPTSFFSISRAADEEDLATADLESILDDCIALNMQRISLQWHYRSRHESLIAFSNQQFYDRSLHTFPSADDRVSRVSLIPCGGVYKRGSGTNRKEAEAIVAELQRRSQHPEERQESVGVVTFNAKQQLLIERLIDKACQSSPEFAQWIDAATEPLIVRNLENMQGDERDVIMLSISYARDEGGKLIMNFGPLNRSGGWRRLNVAVTRARSAMMVFASMKAEDIDLTRTSAEGAAALRSFLQYAAGQSAPYGFRRSDPGAADPVAVSIAAALQAHGYQTELHVGRSTDHVDVAVIDPAHPGRYVLGVLLDRSGNAVTVHDAEITQPALLNNLGWKLHRVRCINWWYNRSHELSLLLRVLEAALQTGN